MSDYTLFYKESLDPELRWEAETWDLFISAYNSSERVQTVFDKVQAGRKHWLVQAEYGYKAAEFPAGEVFAPSATNEAEFVLDYVEKSLVDISGVKLCIDITGFMRPQLLMLVYYLRMSKIPRFDALYAEPGHYAKKEKTTFSDGPISEVRQVAGFEGSHLPDTSKDVLVLGSGYDTELMRAVAEDKESARKVQLLGLPSLRPEMYQENILQVAKVGETIGKGPGDYPGNYFVPASDPFVTATLLSEVVAKERKKPGVTNLYLCPTGTKAQTLGFGLFYLYECMGTATSVVFPFRSGYTRETTKGISRVWQYTIEF